MLRATDKTEIYQLSASKTTENNSFHRTGPNFNALHSLRFRPNYSTFVNLFQEYTWSNLNSDTVADKKKHPNYLIHSILNNRNQLLSSCQI